MKNMMDIEKLVQICGYVLRKYNYTLNYTKLIKLLYLADKEALSQSDHTITGNLCEREKWSGIKPAI
jgi:hypothetical protein